MTKKDIQRRFTPGQIVTVTNHYIDRPDHPCFGTRQRTVLKVTSTSLWFASGGPEGFGYGGVKWPNAAQMTIDGDVVRFYGGGIGQQPTDLFLTIALGEVS
jgi:hypothetical protein